MQKLVPKNTTEAKVNHLILFGFSLLIQSKIKDTLNILTNKIPKIKNVKLFWAFRILAPFHSLNASGCSHSQFLHFAPKCAQTKLPSLTRAAKLEVITKKRARKNRTLL